MPTDGDVPAGAAGPIGSSASAASAGVAPPAASTGLTDAALPTGKTASREDAQGQIAHLLEAGRVWLAPMAGVTDAVYRGICAEHGCVLATTEMISATGMRYGPARSAELYMPAPQERQVAVQLFGADPDELAKAAEKVEEDLAGRLALIDLNMGCPVPKVTKKGAGAALMRDPGLAARIVSAVRLHVSVPVTAKIRKGWRAKGGLEARDFAKALEQAGASLVTVHGRTAGQLYRGLADWECVRAVKEALSIPVIGNGDIQSAAAALAKIEEYGVDGVMVARGAQGNPWIFSQARALLEGREPTAPTSFERVEMLREHVHRFAGWLDGRHERLGYMPRKNHVSAMRKHAMWYLAGVPMAARLRGMATKCETVADFDAFCDEALSIIAGFDAAEGEWLSSKAAKA